MKLGGLGESLARCAKAREGRGEEWQVLGALEARPNRVGRRKRCGEWEMVWVGAPIKLPRGRFA